MLLAATLPGRGGGAAVVRDVHLDREMVPPGPRRLRPIDLWPLLRAYWIGTFLNNYLPSSVGGDFVRMLTLGPLAPMAPVAASVLVERMTGIAALGLLAAICMLSHAGTGGAGCGAVAAGGRDRRGMIAIWFGGERLLGAGARAANAPRLVGRSSAS